MKREIVFALDVRVRQRKDAPDLSLESEIISQDLQVYHKVFPLARYCRLSVHLGEVVNESGEVMDSEMKRNFISMHLNLSSVRSMPTGASKVELKKRAAPDAIEEDGFDSE